MRNLRKTFIDNVYLKSEFEKKESVFYSTIKLKLQNNKNRDFQKRKNTKTSVFKNVYC